MKITVEGTAYDYDPSRLGMREGMELERVTGMSFDEIQRGLGTMRPAAVGALIYLLKRRAGEEVDWSTLDFDILSIQVEDDPEPPGPTEAADERPQDSAATAPSTSAC